MKNITKLKLVIIVSISVIYLVLSSDCGKKKDVPQRDTTAPVITNVKATDVTPNSAIIRWVTDEPATSAVLYGTTTIYSTNVKKDGFTTSHYVELTLLFPYTKYYFKVVSIDKEGNVATSEMNYSFRTLKEGEVVDTSPPTIEILSPPNNDKISGITVIQAKSEDNVGIVKYELKIDDILQDIKITSSEIYQYELDTTIYPDDKSLKIEVCAYDAQNYSISTNIFATVKNTPTWAIAGTLTGRTVVGAVVYIVKAEVGKDPFELKPILSVRVTETSGEFVMNNVPPGTYYVIGYKDLNGDGILTRGIDETAVYKENGKIKPVVIETTGYVLKDEFKLETERFKISGVAMKLDAFGSNPTATTGISISVKKQEGTFVTSSSGGSFEIDVSKGGYHSIRGYLEGYLPGNSETVYITNNISNLNLIVLNKDYAIAWGHTNPEKGFIYGVVRDNTGAPLPDVKVKLYPKSAYDGSTIITSPNGVFTIKNVEPVETGYVITAEHTTYSFPSKSIPVYKNEITYVELQAK